MKAIKVMVAMTFMAFSILSMAQDKKLFTIEDLIPGGKTYFNHTPANEDFEWWGDECIRLDTDECFLVDKQTGKETVLFTLNEMNSILASSGQNVKIRSLLYAKFPYSEKPLAQFIIAGKYFMLNWKTKTVDWIVSLDYKAENKDWNKESKSLAYTINHNLYVETANGEIFPVSTNGSLDIVYGESVHRDEFGISKGTYWSPTGNLLAFYRMDQSMVASYPQVDISTRCATLVPDKYPMAGETSHKVTVGIFNPSTKGIVYLDAGDPTDRYFTNIAWSPDEKSIYMIELNRDQNHAELTQYDTQTGKKLRTLFEENNDKYVEPSNPIQFLPWDSNKFIYQTRKDGYNHIYLYDINGKQLAQLTKGEFEVISVLGFNTLDKSIVFTSNEQNPLQCNVFAVNMKGKRILLGNGEGWHNAKLSDSGRFISSNYSTPNEARKIDIVSTKTGKAIQVFKADNPWADYKVPEMKTGSIKAADGVTDVYYRLILPTDFDPNKKYPAIVYVYGGPHAHNIDASFNWGARGWDIWMAQKGYVMFCLDNRGSEHRGLEFEQATFRQLGIEEMKDQIEGANFLKSLPYIDENRLGVHGWSFGGYMTTSLMTTYPDVFKVGVAGGPVIDWKYYEVMYGERYMDTPQANPEGYAKTSTLNKVGNLKGRLLIIYGGNDTTCVPQHTLSFIRACIDNGTHPDLFTYPGDGHNMFGTDRVHLHEQISRYFDDFLK